MRRIRPPSVVCAALAATFVASAPHFVMGEETAVNLRLQVVEFDPAHGVPALRESLRLDAEPSAGYFVVQFRQPIKPALLGKLRATGAQPLYYLPDQAYAVHLPEGKAAAVRALPEVRWLGAIQPGWKIAPDLGLRPFEDPTRRAGGLMLVTVDLFPSEDLAAAAARAVALGAEVIKTWSFPEVRRLLLRASSDQVVLLANLQAVAWIEEFGEAIPLNDTARWVVQTNVVDSVTVWDHGLHGENQIIGIIDTMLDTGSCYFRDPVNNNPGPNHRKIVGYHGLDPPFSPSDHGTHVAGTAAGDQFPITGASGSNGEAYAARISFSVLADVTGCCTGTGPSNLYQMLQVQRTDGARVHSNSWGDCGSPRYGTWSQDIDRFSNDFEESLVVFATCNAPNNEEFLGTPASAKNVLSVAASQNGLAAENYCTGAPGPTVDGRRRPEILAPGCSIVSALRGNPCSTRTFTGASMATPAVAAAGALTRQYFVEGWYPTGAPVPAHALIPTGALIKAMLLNSAVDMANIPGYPSNTEGWGRVLLENSLYFPQDSRGLAVLADVRNANGLTTGESVSYPLQIVDDEESLEVTLVFTEPPAAILAKPATVNNLDVEVRSPSGAVYKGNVFNAGVSAPGGDADPINNSELIVIPDPEVGEWRVTVRGTAVNQSTQGYALVATGQVELLGSLLLHDDHAVVDPPPLGNGDGLADPGETLTLPVALRNLLPDGVSSVTGRVRTDLPELAQVTVQDSAYPDIPGNSAATSFAPHYRLTIAPDATCGVEIPLNLDARHSTGSSSSSFSLEVGSAVLGFPAGDVPRTIPGSARSCPRLRFPTR